MGHDDDRLTVRPRLLEHLLEDRLSVRIQIRFRRIKNQKCRISVKRSGDSDQLSFSCR